MLRAASFLSVLDVQTPPYSCAAAAVQLISWLLCRNNFMGLCSFSWKLPQQLAHAYESPLSLPPQSPSCCLNRLKIHLKFHLNISKISISFLTTRREDDVLTLTKIAFSWNANTQHESSPMRISFFFFLKRKSYVSLAGQLAFPLTDNGKQKYQLPFNFHPKM